VAADRCRRGGAVVRLEARSCRVACHDVPQLIDPQPPVVSVGVVYLSGVVSAGEFRGAAESVAHEAPGVTRIVNMIAVSH
jgi:hypothetical protein